MDEKKKLLENTFAYNLEEIEIKIESMKQQMDSNSAELIKRCRHFERNFKAISSMIHSKLDEGNLFSDITLAKMQSKSTTLNKLLHVYDLYTCCACFEPSSQSFVSCHIGEFREKNVWKVALQQANQSIHYNL